MNYSQLQALLRTKSAVSRPEAVARVRQAGRDTDTEPTEGQREAGNYAKGDIFVHGLHIKIENPKGSWRRGTSRSGVKWKNRMRHAYGYIKRVGADVTEGKDGDHVDVFVSHVHPHSEIVYVINQVDPATGKLDEHKCVMGCVTEQEARDTYLANYQEGWQGLGSVKAMTMPDFKEWLRTGDMEKSAIVEQRGDKWVLLTKDRSRVLGTHDSAQEAYGQEYAIHKSQEREKDAAEFKPSWGNKSAQETWEEDRRSTPPCPECKGANCGHVRSMQGNARCNDCGHIYTDPEYGKKSAGMKCPTCGKRPSKFKKLGDAIKCGECDKTSEIQEWFTKAASQPSRLDKLKERRPDLTESKLKEMGRKVRVETHEDECCPHCDYVFPEKGGPRITNHDAYWKEDAPAIYECHQCRGKFTDKELDDDAFEAKHEDTQEWLKDSMRETRKRRQTWKSQHPDWNKETEKQAAAIMPFVSMPTSVEAALWLNNLNKGKPDAQAPVAAPESTREQDVTSAVDGIHATLRDGGLQDREYEAIQKAHELNPDDPAIQSAYARAKARRSAPTLVPMLKDAFHEDDADSLNEWLSKDAAVYGYMRRLLQLWRTPGVQQQVEHHMTQAMPRRDALISAGKAMALPVTGAALPALNAAHTADGVASRLTNSTGVTDMLRMRPSEALKKVVSDQPGSRRSFVLNLARGLMNPAAQQAAGQFGRTALQVAALPTKLAAESLDDTQRAGIADIIFELEANDENVKDAFHVLEDGRIVDLCKLAAAAAQHADMDFDALVNMACDEEPGVKTAASIMPLLRRAKEHSDEGQYREKSDIMRALLVNHADDFHVDEDDGGHVVGLTHTSSGFRMHIPRAAVPPEMLKASPEVQKAAATAEPPAVPALTNTGPDAIMRALQGLNMDEAEKDAYAEIKSGKVTRRDKAVRTLNILQGLRRNNIEPHHLMITKIPVIPAQFRPFSVAGRTFVPGDANELYRDLFNARDVYKEHVRDFGHQNAGDARLTLYGAMKAVMGYGEPVNQKTQVRGVSGFLKKIIGSGPKHSWLMSKMLAKPVDTVGRGVIVPNPDFHIDQIGIPEEMAWGTMAPYIQQRLVRSGMSSVDAVLAIKNRDGRARKALELETAEGHGRPYILSRAPAWHKHSVVAGWAKIIPGHTIQINPYISTGLNADYDGDECRNQLYACIPESAMQEWGMSYSNLQSHEVRFPAGSAIPTMQDSRLFLFDLEDFPHGEMVSTKQGQKGRIDFHDMPHPIHVLAYDEATGGLRWSQVAFWSKHYKREIEIVDTHNDFQIITDDDPRAVYGTAAGSLEMARFTPTAALSASVLIPRARRMPSPVTTVTEVAGCTSSTHGKATKMRETIALTARVGWLLGAMCGDGWVCKSNGVSQLFCFSDNDGWNVAQLKAILPDIARDHVPSGNRVVYDSAEPGRYGSTVSYRFGGHNTAQWFRDLIGGDGDENTSGSANKHLPAFYLSAPVEFREGLFAGLMDTDGSIAVSSGKSKPQLMANFTTTSLRLAQETKLLAASLGIAGRITPSETPLEKDCWQVAFSNGDIQRWAGRHMVSRTKLDKLKSVPVIEDSPVTAKYDILPISSALADFMARSIGCPKIRKSDRANSTLDLSAKKATQSLYMAFAQARNSKHEKYGAVSRKVAKAGIERVGEQQVSQHPDGARWLAVVLAEDVTWERVVGVQRTGIFEDGYDLTVPGYETFMAADGIILSNTVNLHVPSQPNAVKEAINVLMPSKMLFKIRDPDSVINSLKHEQILGLHRAAVTPATAKHIFSSQKEALSAIQRGEVALHDDIEIGVPTGPALR